MLSLTDQTGSSIFLKAAPRRIVSLVPSQTELLAHLGLDDVVVGITKFCVHPQHWFRSKERIGGTKTVNVEKVLSLQPDLVLASKEENVREQVEALALRVPVYVSDVATVHHALDMITDVGRLTGTEQKAAETVLQIKDRLNFLKPAPLLRAAYLIWQEPWMTVGGDTFIHSMMEHAGFENIFGDRQRYPAISLDEIKALNPEVVLLSSEPFPFGSKHQAALQPHFPAAKVALADGEMFSWFGSRMLQAPAYFAALRQQLG